MTQRRQYLLDTGLRLNLARYRLLLAGLSPYLIGYTLWRAFKDGGWRYLAQRLGFGYVKPWSGKDCLWLHCASVGEVNAAMPLISLLREHRAQWPLLITTNTPTAAAVLRRRGLEGVVHAFLPLDLAGPVDLFLRRYRPRVGLIMETELWANLYNACALSSLPLVLVNGRLSPRTLSANAWLKAAYRVCFAALDRVLARSDADAQAFVRLGADPQRVETIGSIKFAEQGAALVTPLLQGNYLLAISTHDDEELRLTRIWHALQPEGWVLVIAPRHPERRQAIVAQLRQLGSTPVLRSESAQLPERGIYLADTLGEMPGLIAGARLVVMGGSLIERGGQNPLEPARAGKPVICGPHMENFATEMQALLAADAVVQVRGDDELKQCLDDLLARPEAARRLGRNAAAMMQTQADMAERYFSRLAGLGLL